MRKNNIVLQSDGLINQHDWNIISDRIYELTMIADKPVSGLVEPYIALAFGAAENVEEFFLYRHLSLR